MSKQETREASSLSRITAINKARVCREDQVVSKSRTISENKNNKNMIGSLVNQARDKKKCIKNLFPRLSLLKRLIANTLVCCFFLFSVAFAQLDTFVRKKKLFLEEKYAWHATEKILRYMKRRHFIATIHISFYSLTRVSPFGMIVRRISWTGRERGISARAMRFFRENKNRPVL